MSLQDLRNHITTFDPTVTPDDFLNQLLSGLQTTVSWPAISAGNGRDGQNKPTLPLDVDHFDDQSALLSSKLRQHQISAAGGVCTALKSLQLSRGFASAGESAVFQNDDDSPFKSPIGDNNSIQNLFHGFTGSTGAAAALITAGGGGEGGTPSQPGQKLRARRGQATDPHSIAERLRRERIAERMKALQEIVPNANKTDKASMLDDIIDYVKFLQLQLKALSMSRLGSVADTSIVTERGGGSTGRSSNEPGSFSTLTENQVAKLMEEDMGSAMQYLQGKGLCLMPISLASTLSTAGSNPLGGGEGGGPSSPNVVSIKDSS